MQTTRQHRPIAFGVIKGHGLSMARKLARELLSARHELFALQNDFLELGLQASQLTGERDLALASLKKTEAYIAFIHPGRGVETAGGRRVSADSGRPTEGQQPVRYSTQGDHGCPRQSSGFYPLTASARQQAVQHALDTIKAHIIPQARLLEADLSAVRGELVSLKNTYRELAGRASTITGERDAALKALHEARQVAGMYLPGAGVNTLQGDQSSDAVRNVASEDSAGEMAALYEILGKTRNEKNDVTIQLAESEDRLVALQHQEAQLREEIGTLQQQLTDRNEEQSSALGAIRDLTLALEAARDERTQVGSSYEEQIRLLQQRLADLEPALVQANRRIEDLDLELARAAYRQEVMDRHTVAERRAIPGGWTKIVAGFVFLLGVIASLTKIPGVDKEEIRWAGVSREVGTVAGQNTASQDSLLSAETGALDVSKIQLYGWKTGEQAHDDEEAEQENRALPLAQQQKVPVFSAPGSFNAGHNVWTDGEPRVRVYLSGGEEVLDKWYGACVQGGGDDKECKLLEQNLFREGVIRLPGGVQYRVIKNGSGASPGMDDTVRVKFRAMLLDGTEFDSSRRRGGSSTFRVAEAIPGLQDVLPYMEEGARWEVYIPSELAFREPAAFGGQTVVFEIELVAIATPG